MYSTVYSRLLYFSTFESRFVLPKTGFGILGLSILLFSRYNRLISCFESRYLRLQGCLVWLHTFCVHLTRYFLKLSILMLSSMIIDRFSVYLLVICLYTRLLLFNKSSYYYRSINSLILRFSAFYWFSALLISGPLGTTGNGL